MVSAPANQDAAPLLPPDVGYIGAGRVVSSSNTLMVVGFLRKALILNSTCLRYSSLDQASQYSRLPQVLDTRKILGLAARLRISWRDLDTGGGQTATIIVAGCSH